MIGGITPFLKYSSYEVFTSNVKTADPRFELINYKH
jgi:hypothetical protein